MQTRTLIDRLVSAFPRRKAELEKLLKEMGIEEPQVFYASAPESFHEIPTFDGTISKLVSPMLRERFESYGTIFQGPELWLSCPQIDAAIHSEEIATLHVALRNNWEGSVPARFSDQELSIFGYTPGVFDEAVYLAWVENRKEPIVAEYKSMSVNEFLSLDDYLRWKLERT